MLFATHWLLIWDSLALDSTHAEYDEFRIKKIDEKWKF